MGSNMCQLNHAGASPSPQCVIDRVQQHIVLEQQIGGYAAAEAVSGEIDGIYQNIATLIHAKSDGEIALTESATVAWTRAFYAMAEKQLRESKHRDVILISDADYAANVVAACQWARTHKWTVLSIPSSIQSSGTVDVELLDKMLTGKYEYTDPIDGAKVTLDPARIALCCITQVPTNSGD
jgi:cysteine desulfurase/selenocysteine lyase